MTKTIPLESGNFYHIYNRGNNKEKIFQQDADYVYFLNLLAKHLLPTTDIYCYSLLSNHFHLLVRIKEEDRIKTITGKDINVSQCFSNCFNAYAKAYNKKYNRTGKLFAERFKRKLVACDGYLSELIFYIHANPQRHQVIKDFKNYKYSSYNEIISTKPTILARDKMLAWFGGKFFFQKFHEERIVYSLNYEGFEDQDNLVGSAEPTRSTTATS